MTMKKMLHAASLGSVLILMASGCSKRDQYQRGAVPANPDPLKTSLTSDVTPPGAGLNTDGGSKPAPDSNAGPSALSPAEIVAKVSEWNAQPVIWNESAGNVKLGETDWNAWYDEYVAFRRDGRVNFGFVGFNASQGEADCNYVQKEGSTVCGTAARVTIFQNYEGPLAFPNAKNELVPVRMNSSLRDSVYSAADIEGAIVVGAPADVKKRGEEFFRRFFNVLVAPAYTSSTVDCFAEGRCSYDRDPESRYYLWSYSAPGGMNGYVILSSDQDRLLSASFYKSATLPIPKSMNSTGSMVDLLDGTISLPEVNGGVKFQLGEPASNFAKLDLPAVNWSASAGYAFQEYSGFFASFAKRNQQRLADAAYSQADVNDPSSAIVFNGDYAAAIQVGDIPLTLLNPQREAYTKKEHLAELEDLRLAIEKTILADAGNQILISRIAGDGQESTQYGSFSLNIVYSYEGKYYEFAYATSLKSATASASLQILEDFEVALLSPAVVDGAVAGFGPFQLRKPVQLENLDLDLTNRATITLGNVKARVNISKFVKSRVGRVFNNLPDLVTYDEVLKFGIGSLTVDLVACRKLPNNNQEGYCVLTFYTSQFSWPERVKAFNDNLRQIYSAASDEASLRANRQKAGYLAAEIPTCSGTAFIQVGQTKKSAELGLMSNKCQVLGLSAESAETDKTSFYLFETSNAFFTAGENNRFVDLFQFY
jgi:hypothetical protein